MKSTQCFICGQDNPKGLHIHFAETDDGQVVAHYTCEEWHEGWPGVQHGGLTSALLDEAAGYIPHLMGIPTMTASLAISFAAPIRVGERLLVRAKPTKVNKRLIEIYAWIESETGELKAAADAKMMVLSDQHLRRLGLVHEATHQVKNGV